MFGDDVFLDKTVACCCPLPLEMLRSYFLVCDRCVIDVLVLGLLGDLDGVLSFVPPSRLKPLTVDVSLIDLHFVSLAAHGDRDSSLFWNL